MAQDSFLQIMACAIKLSKVLFLHQHLSLLVSVEAEADVAPLVLEEGEQLGLRLRLDGYLAIFSLVESAHGVWSAFVKLVELARWYGVVDALEAPSPALLLRHEVIRAGVVAYLELLGVHHAEGCLLG